MLSLKIAAVLILLVVILAAGIIARVCARNRELFIAAKHESEAKSAFLANISHEIRTNLNVIIGLTELELENHAELKESTEINLEKVYTAGTTLLGIANDILDISKIESGCFELVHAEYSLSSFINDAITQNMVRIKDKPVKLDLDIKDDLPAVLYGDELRIKQVLNNLLSNAIKYTNRGSVTLSINCEEDENGGGHSAWLVCKVTDTGIGIKQEDMSKLFSDYSRIDRENNHMIEGTGLGLAITKRLAEKMGGCIGVESKYGEGSAFSFRVRQGVAGNNTIGAGIAEKLKAHEYISGRKDKNQKTSRPYVPYAKVLVVDDMVTNLDVARGIMKLYGITADCVNSGREAIDAVKSEKVKYNAIFMDYMMPEMDGIETTQIIRNEIKTEYAKTVPIIALTADAIAGNAEKFLQSGFQSFISKPINVMEMNSVINTFVRDKKYEEEEERVKINEEYNTCQKTSNGVFNFPSWKRFS